MLRIGHIFENLRYAITRKRKDRSEEFRQLAKDVRLPAVLTPRDKHGHKDADFWRQNIPYTLGYARFAMAQDKEIGKNAVSRVYPRAIADGYVEFLVLAYSGGLAFSEMQKVVPEMLASLEYADRVHQEENYALEDNHILDYVGSFFEAMPALTMFIALHRTGAEIDELLSHTGVGGRDMFFDRIAQRFRHDRVVGDRCAISRHYELLVEAMDAPACSRPGLIRKFLDGWYAKALSKSPAYGSHARESYAGYWSHEAAAVVMLWDIDDSTFRDHRIYPDELVAHYRSTGN